MASAVWAALIPLLWWWLMGAEIVSVKSLFWAMGIVFAAGAVQAFVTRGSFSGSVISLSVISGFLILAAFSWSWLEKALGPRLVQSIYDWSSDFRVWLALILLLFVYGAAMSILGWIERYRQVELVQTSILPMQWAIERLLMPRRLTPDQIRLIGAYLRQYPPATVTVTMPKNDTEARDFVTDLNEALSEGGWETVKVDRVDEAGEGLAIRSRETMETSRSYDANVPRPAQRLQHAFLNAGITIDSMGGESGGQLTRDEYFIDVGTRRRDADAQPVKLK